LETGRYSSTQLQSVQASDHGFCRRHARTPAYIAAALADQQSLDMRIVSVCTDSALSLHPHSGLLPFSFHVLVHPPPHSLCAFHVLVHPPPPHSLCAGATQAGSATQRSAADLLRWFKSSFLNKNEEGPSFIPAAPGGGTENVGVAIARCAFSDRNFRSRMPLAPTQCSLAALICVWPMTFLSGVHCSYRYHHKSCLNTAGRKRHAGAIIWRAVH
jgi:hypothetical protein